jgi:hypothetical protein
LKSEISSLEARNQVLPDGEDRADPVLQQMNPFSPEKSGEDRADPVL